MKYMRPVEAMGRTIGKNTSNQNRLSAVKQTSKQKMRWCWCRVEAAYVSHINSYRFYIFSSSYHYRIGTI